MTAERGQSRLDQATQEAAVAHFAFLSITSLITTCGGALVAVLSFAAQAKPLDAGQIAHLAGSLGALGAALFLALITACLGYLYQYTVAYPPERRWIWYVGIVTVSLSLLSLVLGGLEGFHVVLETVDAPKPAPPA